jgi:putative phage-type endonuclease
MGALSVRDQTHWHELRSQHIGASDVAALFDMSPFTTLWQLWMEKSGKLPPEDLSDNKSVQAGTFLESGIANWAAHRWDMKIEKVVDYYTADDCPGMGASLDFQTDGGHPVEIKWSAHGDGWEYEGDTITCAPDNYVLQVLHQMACTDAEYGWLIALIRNEPRRMKVPRSEEIISKIKSHVAKFWDSVRAGEEPPVDFDKDGEAVVRLLDFVPMSEVTLTTEHAHLFQTYLENAAVEKEAKAKKDAAKTELLTLSIEEMKKMNTSQDKAVVKCGDHKLSISTVKASVGTEITAEMIGNFYGARSGYKKVTVSK